MGDWVRALNKVQEITCDVLTNLGENKATEYKAVIYQEGLLGSLIVSQSSSALLNDSAADSCRRKR